MSRRDHHAAAGSARGRFGAARHSVGLAASLLLLAACTAPRTDPYAPLQESARNPARAADLTRQAASLIETDPGEAESLLREALTADLFHGPAHNNRGVLYLAEDKLYEAAGEFEWARKLMPGHPDPRVNLGLTLERAGRTQEALETYETALEVHSEHLSAIEAIARLTLRAGLAGEKIPEDRLTEMLHMIAERGETDEWRAWARQQLARLGR